MILSRRSFLQVLAAPAIVRAASLMPVSAAKLHLPGTGLILLESNPHQVSPWYTAMYLTDDAPTQFTGFMSLVPTDQIAERVSRRIIEEYARMKS